MAPLFFHSFINQFWVISSLIRWGIVVTFSYILFEMVLSTLGSNLFPFTFVLPPLGTWKKGPRGVLIPLNPRYCRCRRHGFLKVRLPPIPNPRILRLKSRWQPLQTVMSRYREKKNFCPYSLFLSLTAPVSPLTTTSAHSSRVDNLLPHHCYYCFVIYGIYGWVEIFCCIYRCLNIMRLFLKQSLRKTAQK